MSLSYRIDASAGLITLTASGEITAADISGYVSASRNDPAFRPGFRRLLVVDGVTGFPQLPVVQQITIRRPGEQDAPVPRIAAVADTPLARGMIAMFLGHWGLADQYRLFDDVPSAKAWVLSDEPS